MSLNRILNDSETAQNEPINILVSSINIASSSPYSVPLNNVLFYESQTTPIVNHTNNVVVANVPLIAYKIGRMVNITVGAFVSDTLNVGGVLRVNLIIPVEFRPYLGSNHAIIIPKSRNADLPVFKAEASVVLSDSDNYIFIDNTQNGGVYPNGENVICNSFTLSFIGSAE